MKKHEIYLAGGCFWGLQKYMDSEVKGIIETETGYYECQKCHNKYVPKYSKVYFAMHFGTTRYMKCPKCNEKSWQRKVLSK